MTAFDRRLTNLPDALWQTTARIDAVKGQWTNDAGLSQQVLSRLKRSVLVTSAGASTRIEGAQLSDEEVEQLMRGLSLRKLADRDVQEVRGYLETLQLVFNSWQDMPLTENTVKQLHTRLLGHVAKDEHHRGAYKTLDNSVQMTDPGGRVVGVLFKTTPPYLTAKQMDELIAWTNQALAEDRYHPLHVIGNFVVEFLKIHPFLDGNGRLSRVLTTLLMLRAGYRYVPFVSHEHLVEVSKTDYYLALRRSQTTFGMDKETILPWLTFFLEVCRVQAEQAATLLGSEAIERLLSPGQLKIWRYLDTVEDAAPGQIADATGVPRPTVAQALDKLRRLDAVERFGLGRSTRYRKRPQQVDER
jgi:Fic family protein